MNADLAPSKILLGVSGGIAAYKAPEIVRSLVRAGFEVQVVMTPAAQAFVTEMALATVSARPVRTTLLDAGEEGRVGHIELADWPDLVIVAPATADLMARAAAGMADDLLSTVLLATRAPVLWAPAMNTNMWNHPATRANLRCLSDRGASFVGPDSGELACGWVGAGRMIDPPQIVEAAQRLLADHTSWAGRRVLVSAGPTRAYLDPVRFFTNASTGVMGFAMAEAAARSGADVTLVAGPVSLPTPPGVRRVDVETADEMLSAMDEVLSAEPCDLVAMVAAVADLAPASAEPGKLDKQALVKALSQGAFVEGVDVLQTLVARHGEHSFFLGFGAQTVGSDDPSEVDRALVEAGRAKLQKKGCHAIFVNRVGVAGTGFSSDTNAGVFVHDDAELPSGPSRPKLELADWILDRVAERLSSGR